MGLLSSIFGLRSRKKIDRLRRESDGNGETEWLRHDHNERFAKLFPYETVQEIRSRDMQDKRIYDELEESVETLRGLREELNGD